MLADKCRRLHGAERAAVTASGMAAMSLAAVVLWIGNFSLTFTFPSIKEGLGWSLNFWLYALICIVGFVVMYYKLPETKGKSLEQIEKELGV